MKDLFHNLFRSERNRHQALASAYVAPEAGRCVQCGICSFNCPLGIDVRAHARLGQTIMESRCITCGECVARCPRGVLYFKSLSSIPMSGQR